MATQRIASWFLTENGKRFSYIFAGTVSTAVLVGTFVPHTVFLDNYKDFVHLYKNGSSVPLSHKLKERFQKTLDLLEIDPEDKHLYRPFSAYGFDIFSAGSAYSRFGVIVGLPATFSYETAEDVDKSSIKVNNASVLWDTDSGELLQKSMVLSENAQIYAIAREIKYRQTVKPFMDVISSSLACVCVYTLACHINTKFNFYSKPLGIRLTMYGLVSSFIAVNYFMFKDATQIYYEQKIDTKLVEKNPIFVEGGKEFYSKTLQRNIALRKLLGKDGESMFTALGNENYFIRYKHTPLVQRKIFFDQALPT